MGVIDSLFVNVGHLGGITVLLYFIPLALITFSILALNEKIQNLRAWYIPVAIIGLLLSVLSSYAGISHVESFVSMSSKFTKYSGAEASLGLGAYTLLLTYFSISVIPLFCAKQDAS